MGMIPIWLSFPERSNLHIEILGSIKIDCIFREQLWLWAKTTTAETPFTWGRLELADRLHGRRRGRHESRGSVHQLGRWRHTKADQSGSGDPEQTERHHFRSWTHPSSSRYQVRSFKASMILFPFYEALILKSSK